MCFLLQRPSTRWDTRQYQPYCSPKHALSSQCRRQQNGITVLHLSLCYRTFTLTACLNTLPVCHSLWQIQQEQCHVGISYCAIDLLLKQWPLKPGFTLYTLHLAAPCVYGFPIMIHNHHFSNQRYPSRRCNEIVCLLRYKHSWTRLWRPRSVWHLGYNVIILWYEQMPHKARVFLPCLVRHI